MTHDEDKRQSALQVDAVGVNQVNCTFVTEPHLFKPLKHRGSRMQMRWNVTTPGGTTLLGGLYDTQELDDPITDFDLPFTLDVGTTGIIRTRHKDLEWSEWSEWQAFEVA